MKRILKVASLAVFALASNAQAEEIRVKFSVVDFYNKTSPIDWQSGWGQIDISAKGPDGELVYPDYYGDPNTFVFTKPGTYTFDGRGAYVCGLNHNQKIEITSHIVEIRLFGWCE